MFEAVSQLVLNIIQNEKLTAFVKRKFSKMPSREQISICNEPLYFAKIVANFDGFKSHRENIWNRRNFFQRTGLWWNWDIQWISLCFISLSILRLACIKFSNKKMFSRSHTSKVSPGQRKKFDENCEIESWWASIENFYCLAN